MKIDGKAIADDIQAELKEELARRGKRPRLAIVMVQGNLATEKFVTTKKRVAESVGIDVLIERFLSGVSQKELERTVARFAHNDAITGIVVQLPLPQNIHTAKVLAHIPPAKDVDALTGKGSALSPVVLSVKEILARRGVVVAGKSALVIGKGKLVGIPVAKWFQEMGADVSVADVNTQRLSELTKRAEIIVSGAGVAGLIQPDMISDGVVLLDAGTSEARGELKGDADPSCAQKCSVFTPVPGGIGPIAIAMLLKNVVSSAKA